MEQELLIVEHVSKSMKGKVILNNVSFTVKPSEIVGLLGPNGAGKSTCMKIIAGLYKPDHGRAAILGCDPFKQWYQLYDRVGILLEPAIPATLRGAEFLKQIAILKNQPADSIPHLLEVCGLTAASHKKIKHYSFGMKQRLGLAAALIGNPQFLMLDEPFVGLDPLGIQELQTILLNLAKEGTAILLSSHQLADIQPLVDRVLFLREGQIKHHTSDITHANLQALFTEGSEQHERVSC